jgi:putative transposase
MQAAYGHPLPVAPTPVALAILGVLPSHSRPHVSDDNPFSEAQFKTLKYWPHFPARLGSFEDAEAFCRRFFPWYTPSIATSASP